MADPDPYAQFLGDKTSSKKLGDLVTEDPYAQFLQKPKVGVGEDIAKGAASGLGTGALAIPGVIGDMSDLLAHGSKAAGDYVAGKMGFSPSPDVGPSIFPKTKDLQSDVEKVTGPFYQAQTPFGKAAQTTMSVAPSIALGGETALGTAAKAIGSGALSEGAGEGAKALKGYMPQWAQPYAEPAARAIGAFGGAFTPAGARRVATPNPMSTEQQAAVQALPAGFPMTAGQKTQSPNLMALEARSPNARDVAASQGPAFTGAAMGEAGIPSNNFADIGQGDAVGQRLGALYRSGQISPPEFNQLLRQIGQERRTAQRAAGIGNTPQIDQTRDMVRFGAQNNGTPVLDMPGTRYEFMRGEIQRRIEAAGNPQEKQALSNIRDNLDTAFNNSTGLGDQANQLQTQYANYNVLKNIPPRVGQETIDPQQVLSAVGHGWGNAAANTNRGTLAPLAQNADRVMTPLPKAPETAPDWVHLLGALGGALTHGAAGAHFGGGMGALAGAGEGSLSGLFTAPYIYNAVRDAAGRVAGSRLPQRYLGNQRWTPGPHTTADPDLVARLLLAPPVNQQSGQ